MKTIRKAVIPAAGLGTRFLPATKAQPKEMLTIVDKPTIQFIVEEAMASGIEEILIITGRNKRALEDHFDRSIELELTLEAKGELELLRVVRNISDMVNIHYIRQKEPKGLGHAIACARAFVGEEPFAVLLGDDIIRHPVPCLKQLMDVYHQVGGATVLGVQPVAEELTHRYGIIKGVAEEQGLRVVDLVEKPAANPPSNLAIMGRYILEPEIFACLEDTLPGAGGEIQLTDALRLLAKERPIYAYSFAGKRYDVGDKLGYLQANVELALEREDLGLEFAAYLKELVKGL